jgi:hypothetical protein
VIGVLVAVVVLADTAPMSVGQVLVAVDLLKVPLQFLLALTQ